MYSSSLKRIGRVVSVATAFGAPLLFAVPAFARTATGSLYYSATATLGTTTTTTPGVPSTGAGGDFGVTIAVLAFSALVVIAGLVYFGMRSSEAAVEAPRR